MSDVTLASLPHSTHSLGSLAFTDTTHSFHFQSESVFFFLLFVRVLSARSCLISFIAVRDCFFCGSFSTFYSFFACFSSPSVENGWHNRNLHTHTLANVAFTLSLVSPCLVFAVVVVVAKKSNVSFAYTAPCDARHVTMMLGRPHVIVYIYDIICEQKQHNKMFSAILWLVKRCLTPAESSRTHYLLWLHPGMDTWETEGEREREREGAILLRYLVHLGWSRERVHFNDRMPNANYAFQANGTWTECTLFEQNIKIHMLMGSIVCCSCVPFSSWVASQFYEPLLRALNSFHSKWWLLLFARTYSQAFIVLYIYFSQKQEPSPPPPQPPPPPQWSETAFSQTILSHEQKEWFALRCRRIWSTSDAGEYMHLHFRSRNRIIGTDWQASKRAGTHRQRQTKEWKCERGKKNVFHIRILPARDRKILFQFRHWNGDVRTALALAPAKRANAKSHLHSRAFYFQSYKWSLSHRQSAYSHIDIAAVVCAASGCT